MIAPCLPRAYRTAREKHYYDDYYYHDYYVDDYYYDYDYDYA